jgi:hypothetical protein
MSAESWVAVMTGSLALATFVLAAATFWNVRKTGRLVTATERSAAAGAATVLEIQRDRELAYSPHIDWTVKTGADPNGMKVGTASVENIGRGLALHALCCIGWAIPQGAAKVPTTITTELLDLKPDDTKTAALRERSGVMLTDEMAGGEVTATGTAVAFCQDVLGNYYRFVPYQPLEVYRPMINKAEPRWMVFYRDHVAQLSKY